jgi:hypothetical protein
MLVSSLPLKLRRWFFAFDIGRTAGATSLQGMFTPPWHLIPPLIYSEVRARPLSDLYFLWDLWDDYCSLFLSFLLYIKWVERYTHFMYVIMKVRSFLVFSLFWFSSKLWNLPLAMQKNKQTLKNKIVSTCCMEVQKVIYFFFFKEMKYSTTCEIENLCND